MNTLVALFCATAGLAMVGFPESPSRTSLLRTNPGFQGIGELFGLLLFSVVATILGACFLLIAYSRLRDQPNRKSSDAILVLTIATFVGPAWVILLWVLPSSAVPDIPLTGSAIFLPAPLISIALVVCGLALAIRCREIILIVGSAMLLIVLYGEAGLFLRLPFTG